LSIIIGNGMNNNNNTHVCRRRRVNNGPDRNGAQLGDESYTPGAVVVVDGSPMMRNDDGDDDVPVELVVLLLS